MAEQIAFMHQSGSIPGIPGVFPGGCSVRYDDHTREVLEVKPFEPEHVETPAPQEDKPADENATQPLESPVVETPEPAPVEEPPAQTYINGG